VAAVVPCRNEAGAIALLLDALLNQTRHPDVVIVVDDASVDGTRQIVTAWCSTHQDVASAILDGPGRGAGPAMNAGIRHADADVIVRLDGHCLPDTHYIERSLETLDMQDAGVSGGVWKIAPAGGSVTARGIAAVLSHPFGSGGADYRRPLAAGDQQVREVDTVPFGTFHKSVWAEIGGFDESLVRNQDYDFNYRVRLTGRKVLLNPAIVSVYKARGTLSSLARQYVDYGFWKVVMLRKFPKSIRVRQLLPMLLLPSLLALGAWALLGREALAAWMLAGYAALNLAGAAHASARAGDIRLTPTAFAALVVLQNAWSAGAWTSLVQGARGQRR
jgi:glycosyltransferase involved in cell wall biosynthesis